MSMTTTTRKISTGNYVTPSGHRVERSWTATGQNGEEWQLFDAQGEYCQTYATKAEAVNAAAQTVGLAEATLDQWYVLVDAVRNGKGNVVTQLVDGLTADRKLVVANSIRVGWVWRNEDGTFDGWMADRGGALTGTRVALKDTRKGAIEEILWRATR